MSGWWQCMFIFQTRAAEWRKAELSSQAIATEGLDLTLDKVNIRAHTHMHTHIHSQDSPVLLPARQLETTHPDHTESENSPSHSHATQPTSCHSDHFHLFVSAGSYVTSHTKQSISVKKRCKKVEPSLLISSDLHKIQKAQLYNNLMKTNKLRQ